MYVCVSGKAWLVKFLTCGHPEWDPGYTVLSANVTVGGSIEFSIINFAADQESCQYLQQNRHFERLLRSWFYDCI